MVLNSSHSVPRAKFAVADPSKPAVVVGFPAHTTEQEHQQLQRISQLPSVSKETLIRC